MEDGNVLVLEPAPSRMEGRKTAGGGPETPRSFVRKLFDTTRPVVQPAEVQAMQFEQSVASILKRDGRFDPQAYFFLKDALDFTLKRIADSNSGEQRHVSGPELLTGCRDHALEQFGPMASTLMREWGIRKCQDIGDMVFHLIEEQVFGKQDSDSKEDFSEIFDFEQALASPFIPKSRIPSPAPTTKNVQSSGHSLSGGA